jgi:hypothetical protein
VRVRRAALDFRVACFGHGKAIIGDGASRFRRRWPAGSAPDAEPGDPVVAGERVVVAGNSNSNPATEEVTDDP